MGNIGIWQLLIVLVIIVLLFGTKKLRNIGGDLGGALKSFKKAVNDDEADKGDAEQKKIAAEDDAQFKASEEKTDAKSDVKTDK